MGLKDREYLRKSVVSNMITNEEEKKEKKEKKKLIQRGYYLTPEIAMKVKLRAVEEGKKDYEIVQAALESYLQ